MLLKKYLFLQTGLTHSSSEVPSHNLCENYEKPKLADCPTIPASLPKVNKIRELPEEHISPPLPEEATQTDEDLTTDPGIKKVFFFFEQKGWLKDKEDYSLYILSPDHS